ncbi:MAG: hypothetical protein R2698_07685 [Microthrixaceae bacterium]
MTTEQGDGSPKVGYVDTISDDGVVAFTYASIYEKDQPVYVTRMG